MTAHIIRFPDGGAAPATNEPAAISRNELLPQQFYYWRGMSGRRYLHTVFSLVECPELPKANYLLVRREADGARWVLSIGQTVDDAQSLNLAHLRHMGAKLGANEIHVHLMAEGSDERDRAEADLCAARLTWLGRAPDDVLAAG